MTNTHRKTTTNRTTAKIAAVGAFGVGAALALPGIASAAEAPAPADGSLENTTKAVPAGSNIDTGLKTDVGSLTLDLNLDAGAQTPGSVSFGSVGVSPNTGSDVVDNGSSAPGSSEDETENGDDSGSLDMGSLGGGTGSLPGSSEDDGTTKPPADDTEGTGSLDTGSITETLAGLSSGAEGDATADA